MDDQPLHRGRHRARRPAGLRRLHRVRRAGEHVRRPGAPGRAAARADPLARGRHRRADAPRGGPGDDAAAGAVARAWATPGYGRWWPRRWSTCSTTTSRRGCPSTARSAPPATWPRWPTARWCCSARAGCSARTAPGSPAAEALHAAGLAPIELAAKEGLALINGTDGMLGMLLLAIDDARHLFTMADVTGGAGRSRRCSARTGRSCRSCTRSGRTRARPCRRRTCYRLLQGSAIMDSHRDDLTHAVQDAYSMRCAPQVAGAARDTLDFATPGRRPRAGVHCGQSGGAARRPGAVHRQLPRRAARLRRRLPRHRRGRGRLDLRAPGGPAARRVPLPRPAGVPHARTRASTPA